MCRVKEDVTAVTCCIAMGISSEILPTFREDYQQWKTQSGEVPGTKTESSRAAPRGGDDTDFVISLLKATQLNGLPKVLNCSVQGW